MEMQKKLHDVETREFSRVWEVYKEMGIQERHFNKLQNVYRSLASTWLLAAFAAIGFIISNKPLTPFNNNWLLISGIGIAMTVGITLLWNLDLMVYHQLLASCFAVGEDLEKKYEWLPRMRTDMRKRIGEKGSIPRLRWFYIASNSIGLLISGISIAIWGSLDAPLVSFGAFVSCVVLIILLGRYVATSGGY